MVKSLREIKPDNDTVVIALVELINNTQFEDILWQAAKSLEEIDPSNYNVIAALVKLIGNCQSEDILWQAAKSLGEIGRGNEIAINAFIELICTSQEQWICQLAQYGLEKIATKQKMPEVIHTLKDYLSDDTHKNHCYETLWKYAQTLPYKKFHQAWHRDNTPIGNTPTAKKLERQLTNICTQLQHLPLWCIDAKNCAGETEEAKLAKALRNRIYEQIDPDTTRHPVADFFDLEEYIINLKKRLEIPKIVILIHNCEPEEAIAQFCRKLTNIARIIWITDAPVEPPIKAFSPGHPNLVEAVESWLEELMLWNGE